MDTRIRSASPSHRPHGPGIAHRARHLRVRARHPSRNPLQLLPHSPLKRRGLQVEWHLNLRLPPSMRPTISCTHLPYDSPAAAISPADIPRAAPRPAWRFVSQIDRRHALFGGSHQNFPKRRFCDGISDFHTKFPFMIGSGVMPSCALLRSYTGLDEPYPVSYRASVIDRPERNMALKRSTRRATKRSSGSIPSPVQTPAARSQARCAACSQCRRDARDLRRTQLAIW